MATMVRDSVFNSDELRALREAMGWSEREALGCLVLLWRNSQKAKMLRADQKQIGHWCHVTDKDEVKTLVNALCDPTARWLAKERTGKYRIRGNREEVSKIKAWEEKSKKGGEKTRAKHRKQKDQGNPAQDAEPRSGADGQPSGQADGGPLFPSPSPSVSLSNSISPSVAVSDSPPGVTGEAEAGQGGRIWRKRMTEEERLRLAERNLEICRLMPKPDAALCAPGSPALRDRVIVTGSPIPAADPEEFSSQVGSHIHSEGDVP
jgi:hypothetical protein